MGLLSIVLEGIKTIGKAVVPLVAEKVVEGIQWLGEKLSDFFSDSSKIIGNTDSYDADTASAQETKNLNDDLAKIKNQAIEYGKKLEDDFLQSGKEAVEELIEQIEQGDFINTSSFKEQCDKTLREFRGTTAKNITSKISLGDYEFLKIAKLPRGREKEDEMDDFTRRLAKKAFKEAAQNFTNSLASSIKNVTNVLNVTLQGKQSIIKNTQSMLDTIKKAQKQEQKQEEQVNFSLDLCKKKALLTKMGG